MSKVTVEHGRWSGGLQQPQNFVRDGEVRLMRDAIAHALTGLSKDDLMLIPADQFDDAIDKINLAQQHRVVATLTGDLERVPDLMALSDARYLIVDEATYLKAGIAGAIDELRRSENGENKTALKRIGEIREDDIPLSLPPDPCEDLPWAELLSMTYIIEVTVGYRLHWT